MSLLGPELWGFVVSIGWEGPMAHRHGKGDRIPMHDTRRQNGRTGQIQRTMTKVTGTTFPVTSTYRPKLRHSRSSRGARGGRNSETCEIGQARRPAVYPAHRGNVQKPGYRCERLPTDADGLERNRWDVARNTSWRRTLDGTTGKGDKRGVVVDGALANQFQSAPIVGVVT